MTEIAKKLIAKNLKKKEKFLDLGKCGLTDLNAVPELFDCEHLETLILSDNYDDFGVDYEIQEYYRSANSKASNRITTFPPAMARLKKLKTIFATGIGLENIDVFGEMPQLEHLHIDGTMGVLNPIKDIACLAHLPNLRGIDMPYNHNIELNYNVIASAKKLRYLHIGFSNQYAKYTGVLEGLTKLRFLIIDGRFSDLSHLANLTELEVLLARNNHTADISALAKLKNLETLNLEKNYHIEDISSLENLSKLRILVLEQNQVKDISALSNLVNMSYLALSNNYISDISPLAKLTVLDVLLLNKNWIKSIEALREMDYLTKLELAGNKIQDISPLQGLKQLKVLTLGGGNQIPNIDAIKGIKSLKTLTLGGNPMDESVAQFMCNPANYPFLSSLTVPESALTNIPENIKKLQGKDGRFAKLLHEYFESREK
jgi:Leucine-rich repeat (LRR) protein